MTFTTVNTKKDLESESDIQELVDAFYQRATIDDEIGYFFTKVVKLDWEKHMPVMYEFWASIIFQTGVYRGNPMTKHIELNQKSKMEKEHFDRWLALWCKTVDKMYIGPNANTAKDKAKMIMELMRYKVRQSEGHGIDTSPGS